MDIKTKTNSPFDYSLFGEVDSNGKIKQVWGTDALTNSVLMWLGSQRGEIIRNPLKGGKLIPFITKPMNQINLKKLKNDLLSGLQNEFDPPLSNIELILEPNYEKRYWNIRISAWCPTLKSNVNVNEKIKNMS